MIFVVHGPWAADLAYVRPSPRRTQPVILNGPGSRKPGHAPLLTADLPVPITEENGARHENLHQPVWTGRV